MKTEQEIVNRIQNLDVVAAQARFEQIAWARDTSLDCEKAVIYLRNFLIDIQELQQRSRKQVPAILIKKVVVDV